MPIVTVGTNSYISIEDADEALDERYMTDDWFQLDDDNKARLLIMATRQIDRLPCKYDSATEEQTLRYPIVLSDGTTPAGLEHAQEAVLEQAWYMFRNYENIQGAQDQSINNIRSENLGAIQTAKSNAGFNPFKLYAPEALRLMSEFTDFKMKISRG